MSVKGEKMKSRLLNQFSVSTRLKALLDAINNRFDDSDALLEYLQYYRFLDTASGVWLDYIGRLVGLYPRPYDEIDDGIYTFKADGELNDPDLGLSNLTYTTGGIYQSLEGLQTANLIDDTEYRSLIKAKIFARQAAPTIRNIYLFIKNTFGIESTITVTQPGEIEVEIATALTYFQRRVLVNYAPVAAGFNITITNWP